MPTDLTVDVGVVMSGSGLGDKGNTPSSLELMKAIRSKPGFLLALDSKGRIKHQYELKVKRGFGYYWLKEVASKGRIVTVKSGLDRGARVALSDAHFDSEDMKYVETAARTSCRLLVSHDPDYSTAVRKILRRKLSVRVLNANGAIEGA